MSASTLAVLVVDRDDALADLLGARLRDRGHRVAIATSTENARGIARCGARFDVAVVPCDLEERRGGLALARDLVGRAWVARIVTTLDRSNVDDALAAREVGDFVRKVGPDWFERVIVAVELEAGPSP